MSGQAFLQHKSNQIYTYANRNGTGTLCQTAYTHTHKTSHNTDVVTELMPSFP